MKKSKDDIEISRSELDHAVENAIKYSYIYKKEPNLLSYQGKLKLKQLISTFSELNFENPYPITDVLVGQKYEEVYLFLQKYLNSYNLIIKETKKV